MPTGYTAVLYEGKEITFERFAMQCARAFGALITLRDNSLETPIPEEFKPSDWNLKEWDKALEREVKVQGWTKEEAEKEAELAFQGALTHYNQSILDRNSIKKRYGDMLVKVKAWRPPTPDHQALKDFMVQQLNESIRFDCGWEPDLPVKLSGPEYKAQELEDIQYDLAYHNSEYENEVDRIESRNTWIKALRDSLVEV